MLYYKCKEWSDLGCKKNPTNCMIFPTENREKSDKTMTFTTLNDFRNQGRGGYPKLFFEAFSEVGRI